LRIEECVTRTFSNATRELRRSNVFISAPPIAELGKTKSILGLTT
jgi:hypothetical protein